MGLFSSMSAEREAAEAVASERLASNHDTFVADGIRDLGLNFPDMDDAQLADSISSQIESLGTLLMERDWNRELIEVIRGENEIGGDELLRVMMRQNWIIIQQNERIARLLERE